MTPQLSSKAQAAQAEVALEVEAPEVEEAAGRNKP